MEWYWKKWKSTYKFIRSFFPTEVGHCPCEYNLRLFLVLEIVVWDDFSADVIALPLNSSHAALKVRLVKNGRALCRHRADVCDYLARRWTTWAWWSTWAEALTTKDQCWVNVYDVGPVLILGSDDVMFYLDRVQSVCWRVCGLSAPAVARAPRGWWIKPGPARSLLRDPVMVVFSRPCSRL